MFVVISFEIFHPVVEKLKDIYAELNTVRLMFSCVFHAISGEQYLTHGDTHKSIVRIYCCFVDV